jgi:uncharacterized membrane protein
MKDKSFFSAFRQQFTAGLIILVPLITTVILVSWLFRLLDGILGRHFAHFFGGYVHGVGLVSLLLLIWLVGFFGKTYLGSRLNRFKDFLIERIPLVGSLFGSIKQVSDGLLEMDASNFNQVVMIEYPRIGIYAIGFITSRSTAYVTDNSDSLHESDRLAHVFVPTVPNPTSGYLLLVPSNQLMPMALSVEDALKTVLSLGVIHPDKYSIKNVDELKAD